MLRPATEADHAFLTDFLYRDFSQRHAILPVSRDAISRTVRAAINDFRCAVYERSGEIVGSTAIRANGAWYSEAQAAFDLWVNAPGEPIAGGRLRQWLQDKAGNAGLRLFLGVSGNDAESQETARVFAKRHPLVSRTFEASASV